jgi:hypothetical protein
MPGTISVTDQELVLLTPFFQAELVAAVKKLPQRRWDGHCWRIPLSFDNWKALKTLIQAHSLTVAPGVEEQVQKLTSILISCRTCGAQWWWSPFGQRFWWEKEANVAHPCVSSNHNVGLMQ